MLVLVVALALGLFIAGCGSEKRDTGTLTSPISGERRSADDGAGLSPLLVSSAEPAVPFRGSSGKYLVSYELRLFNATPLTLVPDRLSVSTPGGDAIEKLGRRELIAALALPGKRSGVRRLSEAQQATLYLTVEFADRAQIPDRLVHRIAVRSERLPGGRAVSAPAGVQVRKDFDVPVLGPPLAAGRRYIAADSCCSSERHRRALLPVGDRQWLAQRFAVDWEQVDASGRFVKRGGDPQDPRDYAIYGTPAIAAANARVVHVVDGLDDRTPGSLPTGLGPAEADGNSVVARLDGGLYMLYAHLQAGSLKVKRGDRMQRGDPIGLVGNSGNSSAPHLHFHVMDGPSQLMSEGVPYVIDAFATQGRLRSTADFDRYENTTTPFDILPFAGDARNRRQMPLDLTVVDFG